ncbi:MAG: DUF3300 domain-containing protein [Acidobacteriia bacterium]|nr:DUF3300 domain-containing protein [Terriglobia bacterium]
MESNPRPKGGGIRMLGVILCASSLAFGDTLAYAQSVQPTQAPASSPAQAAPKIPNDQLDSLVAPIALYPDPLLAQVLAASTYPLEIVQLQQWLAKNKNLKDKALTDAVMKQPWDPSVQAMAVLPDVVKRLADDVQWTTDLGNAFLAQQSDVMDAVQRMRKKAQATGALKSTEQQKVETQVVENKTVVVVQPASTQVVYVPSYNPVVVYGPPVYPYPPVYYPPPPPPGAYVATAAIAFGVGMAVGAAWGGHYGWGCGWGHNDVNINVNNNFNRNANINRNTNVSANRSGNSSWQHNPQHRGGAPYSNQATANKYGGTARGGSSRGGTGASNRSAGGGASSRGGAGVSNRSAGGGGGDRVGNRSVSSTPSARNTSAFSGASSRTSGSSAQASSSRGASSMGASRSGGGASRGGGGRRR